MRFQLSKSGTITEVREALNAKIAALPVPETQENKVIRMASHYAVADYLDPKHDEWQTELNAVRADNIRRAKEGQKAAAEPAEPKATLAIDVSIDVSVG